MELEANVSDHILPHQSDMQIHKLESPMPLTISCRSKLTIPGRN